LRSLRTRISLATKVEAAIRVIRGQRVILDADIAALYGVETRALVQAVKRNLTRFPAGFMFQLTAEELATWRSQIVMSNPAARMGLRRPPYAFTDYGVIMLSSVLRSARAVQVNIEVVRAFVRLREAFTLAARLDELEQRTDKKFKAVFDAVRMLMTDQAKIKAKLTQKPGAPRRRIGFQRSDNVDE
jgi:hypothetical protein